jgi:hypothetical protein
MLAVPKHPATGGLATICEESLFAMCQWLMPVLATWEAEIWRIKFQGQPRKIVHKTHFQNLPEQNGLEA